MSTTTNVKVSSLSDLLANVGGFTSSVIGIVALALYYYERFTMDKNLVKKFYHLRRDPEAPISDSDSDGNTRKDDAEGGDGVFEVP